MKRIFTKSQQTLNFHYKPFKITKNSSLFSPPISNFFTFNNFITKTNHENINFFTKEYLDKKIQTLVEFDGIDDHKVSEVFKDMEKKIETLEEDDDEVDDVSNEELKNRIEKFYDGDEDAIPSIFEAILKRKLAGKHDESDNELLEKFGSKSPDDDDFDSDEDKL